MPLTVVLSCLGMMLPMAAQTADEIQAILNRTHGQVIDLLQVLGVNSLKTIDPPTDDLVGTTIRTSRVSGRSFCLVTEEFEVTVDLERTGKAVWLDATQPYQFSPGAPRPTVRLIFQGGSGIELTEPAKTKRITVRLSRRHA
jgi:hypothetical protein